MAFEPGRESGSQQPPSAPAEADWLRQMRESAFAERQDQTLEFESEPKPQESEPDRPDWLQRLEAPEEPKTGEPESSQPPDWLRRLEPPAEPSAPPSAPAEEESLEWLDRVEPKTEHTGPVEEDLGVPMPAAETDIPEWLAELTSFDRDVDDGEPSPEGEEQIPDWFTEIESKPLDLESTDVPQEETAESEEAESETPAPTDEQEIPDWLAVLTAEQQIEAPLEEAETSEEEPGITESVMPPDAFEPVAMQEEEVPDWLKEMEAARAELEMQDSGSVEALADEEQVEPASSPAEEAPAWLAEMEPIDTEPEEELPDWAHTVASAEEVDLPDWMAELAPKEEGEATSPQEAPAPDWLTALESAEDKDRSALEAAVPTSEEELPAWLTEMAPSEEKEAALQKAAEQREHEPDSDELADLEPAEVPEWLMESVPSEARPAKEELQVEDLEPPAEGIEVPDWLEQAFATEEEREAAQPQERELEKEDLAQAEIPAWLEALRPDVKPGTPPQEEEEPLETSGLLAGIPGVVPPAAEIAAPPTAPPKPEMMGAEAALARARLWQELIAYTTQPSPIPLPRAKASGAGERVLRWLIYAILLAAIVTPMLADVDLSRIFVTDKPIAPESVVTFNLVDQNVTPDSQVLIAFDYDPAFMGELQLQAGILLQQLARKGARIIALSLTPEGAGLAQQLTEDILPGYGYEPGPDYINLGYLPGEAIGIRSLVLLGGQLSDQTFDGRNLEGTLIRASGEPLRLADMALIVLLTGNPNDLRWWVEQVAVVRRDLGQYPPLVTGVSAAIAPLARPYYLMNPRQIDGLLTGLTGAADYELLLNMPDGPAHARLGGKLLGQLAVAALLLVGIVVYGLSRNRDSSERPGR